MSHNQNNDIMKPTDYIEWDNLKNIPFFLCQVVEDKENKDIDIYYLGKRVFHDYDHVGHYMRSAIILFRRIKNRTADWVNLQNLWTLRNCIRENYNHGIGVDSLIYGEDFDGENPETLTPLTKKRFDLIVKRIFIVVMPLYLQDVDLYHFLVNVIDYPVMGGNVSRPCNIPTAP